MNYIVIYSLNNYIVYLVNIEIIMETKVIENIELLKKLHPYIKGETGYNTLHEWLEYRTLTLEEAIELLLNKFWRAWFTKRIKGDKDSLKFPYWIYVWTFWPWAKDMSWFITKIEAIEKMLEYLINNDLLWNK